MRLIHEIQPDVVNISKFFPRPNTGAGQMKLLSNQIVNDRSRRMTKLVRDVLFKKNKSWLDWVGEILVSEKGKVPNDPWDNEYVYLSPGLHGDFDLMSYGSDRQPGGEDKDMDINNWELE